ncbi:hypothetical protein B0H16DRAFT_1452676 [Mycena metata]|uniref:Uncharacterized protein n=1 Tax=Mycena metata TaxID=1033252 RepID=A0AAD7JSE0_9AGAR|nr:hypothetical protein B0H16DRAFT_1452676 [Mycena metata]
MGNISTPMNPPFAQFDASDVEHLPSTPTPGPAVDRLVANPTGCPAARCSNTGQNSERQPTITTQSGSTVTSETRVAPQPGLQHRCPNLLLYIPKSGMATCGMVHGFPSQQNMGACSTFKPQRPEARLVLPCASNGPQSPRTIRQRIGARSKKPT